MSKLIRETSRQYMGLVGGAVMGRVVDSAAAGLPHSNALGGVYSARLLEQAAKIKLGKK